MRFYTIYNFKGTSINYNQKTKVKFKILSYVNFLLN